MLRFQPPVCRSPTVAGQAAVRPPEVDDGLISPARRPPQADARVGRGGNMPESVFEVRWHARGGQGAVTASRFLAASALRENKYFQGFPEFGTEREGAPIQAFNRISASKIYWHENVTRPDAVVVLDPTLLEVVPVASGLKPGGAIIVNSAEPAAAVRARLSV